MPRGKPGSFTACRIDDCGGKSVGQGLCRKHYTRWWVHGDPSVVVDQSRGVCSIEGCERPHKARGVCQTHYRRLQRHGDTDTVQRAHRMGSPEDRFWAQVDQVGPVPEHRPELGRCWVWTGLLSRYGYGQIAVNQRSIHAHTWGYGRFIGPVPDGRELDHLCRNRACVRFDHLEPVTHRENVLRGVAPSAVHARQTCCSAGHPFTHDNTYRTRVGHRRCKTCHKVWTRAAADRRGVQRDEHGRAVRARKTHCKQGHPMEEGTVYHAANGVRLCIACTKERYRRQQTNRGSFVTMSVE